MSQEAQEHLLHDNNIRDQLNTCELETIVSGVPMETQHLRFSQLGVL